MSYAPMTNMSHKGGFNSHSSSSSELQAQGSHPQVLYNTAAPTRSKRSPRTWGRKAWIIALIVAVIVIVAIVLGAVLGSRANRYPSYSKLNYSILDTCEHPFSLSWDATPTYLQMKGQVSLTALITSLGTIPVTVSCSKQHPSTLILPITD